ncbi:MazG family protein [Nocardioides campestrisoli]|uniref:MazG family protein n=1 Tax=Nocardioides campestrisoli TaxID=2736757 RepID=UPI002810D0AC|nr:MazG family protein [Nocardioides campestrisoli]
MGETEDGQPLLELAAVMRRLRAECPWKAAQTHRSLARFLVEETWETLEAIDSGDAGGDWDHLREELGDLLLQVYFHGAIAEESGTFTLDDVARGITEKLRRRNPHVFGDAAAPEGSELDAAAVNDLWEQAKAAEKQRTSVLDGLPPGLPALLLADKVLDRLERAGAAPFGPASSDLAGRPGERSPERPATMTSEEVGEELLAVVARARADGVDPEQALRDAVRRLAAPPA